MTLLCFECTALHQGVNELADGELPVLPGSNNVVRQLFIGEPERTAQGVLDQVLGEPAGKVFFSFGDQVSQFLVVLECRAFVEGSRGIDVKNFCSPGLFSLPVCQLKSILSPPFPSCIEILEAESDGVDLAVAAGALCFFLVSGQFLSCGQRFVRQA